MTEQKPKTERQVKPQQARAAIEKKAAGAGREVPEAARNALGRGVEERAQ